MTRAKPRCSACNEEGHNARSCARIHAERDAFPVPPPDHSVEIIAALREELGELRAQLARAPGDVGDVVAERDHYKLALEERDAELRAVRSERDHARAERDDAREYADDQRKLIDEAREELESVRDDLKTEREEHAELKAKFAALEQPALATVPRWYWEPCPMCGHQGYHGAHCPVAQIADLLGARERRQS